LCVSGLYAKPVTIPELKQWTGSEGNYSFGAGTRVLINPENFQLLQKPLSVFAEDINEDFGIELIIVESGNPQKGDLLFSMVDDDGTIGNSGYIMEIGEFIHVKAVSDTGVFYATRSLIQMLKQGNEIEWGIAKDYPDYPERGMMIDNGRKYFSVKTMKDYIRELSYFKMNLFHWHVSDNEGFRLQSEKYPFIQSDEFYTKDEIKELLQLAEKYYVNVVPEIDVPNHFAAVISHFPEFQIHDKDGNSIGECCIDYTNPEALAFLKDLFSEYIELFPGNYWHLGGDEFHLDYSNLPQFEQFAKEKYGEEAKSIDAFIWFINEMNSFVNGYGKRLRIWNDVYEDIIKVDNAAELDSEIVVEYWNGECSPNLIRKAGHKLMNTNSYYLYYVVGSGWRPNQNAIYYDWTVNHFFGDIIVGDKESVLGAKLQIWADTYWAETEMQVFRSMQAPIRIFAHRTWNSELFKEDLEKFRESFKIIGNTPFVYPDSILIPNNLCILKRVVSSSNENNELIPENAVDGDYDTRWSSAYVDTAWIYVDFEKVQPFTRVKLFWEWSFAKDYQIQVSDDAQNWKTILSVTDSDGYIDDYPDLPGAGRYLRIYCTRRNGFNGNSLWEIEAYDSTALNANIPIENFEIKCLVYPNPSFGNLNINYELDKPGLFRIELFDVQGQKAGTLLEGYRTDGFHLETINLPHVAGGEYFMKFILGSRVIFRKIIILKN
jgi:hexosaminidase